jgi:diaminopimelate epimerase
VIPGVRTIHFVKASACGNDFLLIDSSVVPASERHVFTKEVCDRHEGVGADGVEWMSPHASADVEIQLINADGSDAEISGNGTRCVAAYLVCERGHEKVRIHTGAGLKTCVLTSRNECDYEFEMAIGPAEVDEQLLVSTSTGEVQGIRVSTGNPHYVIFVDEFPSDWQSQSAEIQRSPNFPHSVNVEWVKVDGRRDLRALFFERGAGETRSSGTGSCASAVAAMASGRAESAVKVHAPGGTQIVRRQGDDVFLRGPARLLCRGEFFLGL